MLVTEIEAKEKRCVMMASALVALPIDRRNAAALNGGNNCIGSACMAWRWFDPALPPIESRRGFCGLAGVVAP